MSSRSSQRKERIAIRQKSKDEHIILCQIRGTRPIATPHLYWKKKNKHLWKKLCIARKVQCKQRKQKRKFQQRKQKGKFPQFTEVVFITPQSRRSIGLLDHHCSHRFHLLGDRNGVLSKISHQRFKTIIRYTNEISNMNI